MIKPITLADVEQEVFVYAQKHFGEGEAIPPFANRYLGKLESCLAVPFQIFGDT